MTYNLFLDDERDPPFPRDEWCVARSSEEAIEIIRQHGLPKFMSLDHDLGGDDTGMKFAHLLIDYCLDSEPRPLLNTDYEVHSQNPVGKANLLGLLDQFFRGSFA